MSPGTAQVTAAEISRLADVSRATVTNWRRRHADFPPTIGGTESSPVYDLDAVRSWLAARNRLPAATSADTLREHLRRRPAEDDAGRLVPLLMALPGLPDSELASLEDLTADALRRAARALAESGTTDPDSAYGPDDVQVIRSLIQCVRQEGPESALSVLIGQSIPTGSINFTPRWLAELMTGLLFEVRTATPRRVLDPACGVGELLVAAAARGARELYGQDVAASRATLAAAAVRLGAGEAVVQVAAADSIRHDAFTGLTVDGVLCAPPFGVRDWGRDDVAYDPRWVHGLPPKTEPELAWLQHCLSHLAPDGRAVLLLPPAVAERASARRIRAALVRSGALRAVIALPPGAAAPAHVGLHLWVLEQARPEVATPPGLLLVDATRRRESASAGSGNPSSQDWDAVSSDVMDLWQRYVRDPDRFGAVPGVARTVPAVDLLDDAVDLTPARYVRALPPTDRPDLFAQGSQSLRLQLVETAQDVVARGSEPSWPAAGPQLRSWSTTTVADLVAGNAVTVVHQGGTDRMTSSGRPTVGSVDATAWLQEGDVILPAVLSDGAATAQVVAADAPDIDGGAQVHIVRPDQQRFDPWFLAGFLSSQENVSAASTGSTVVRLDLKRLRVPLLPIAEQRAYGAAFRRLRELRDAADLLQQLATRTASTLQTGLTCGALLPSGAEPPHG